MLDGNNIDDGLESPYAPVPVLARKFLQENRSTKKAERLLHGKEGFREAGPDEDNRNEIIDAVQIAQGIRDPEIPKLRIKNKVRVFSLDVPDDREAFEALSNNPERYVITYQDHNWDKTGSCRLVVFYYENLDVAERQDAEAEAKEKSGNDGDTE